jgi:DNA-binding NtrC family response regulator
VANKGQTAGTILIVDDEPGVLQITRIILERAGFVVLTAENGQIGLDMFQRHEAEIHLALVDMTMPVLSGEETVQGLNRIRPGMRIIVSSGHGEDETMARMAQYDVAGVIQKPFHAQTLVQKVRAAMEERPAGV